MLRLGSLQRLAVLGAEQLALADNGLRGGDALWARAGQRINKPKPKPGVYDQGRPGEAGQKSRAASRRTIGARDPGTISSAP